MTDVSSTSSSTTTYVTTSNIDSEALIESAVAQRLAPADRLEVKIEEAEVEVAAYEELQSLGLAMESALSALTNPDDGSTDAFEEKAAYLTSTSGADPSSLLGVTVAEDAQTGSYELEIVQTAEVHKIAGSEIASNSEALGFEGTISLAVEDGTAASIDIATDMSLAEIAEAINAETDTTGVTASVIKVSESAYRLVLTAEDTAKEIVLTDDSGSALQDLGVIDSGGAVVDELQAAQAAIIVLDGIEITRDNNEIDDVLDGVTFYLYEAEAGTTLQMDVESDLSSVVEQLEAFVEAYNAYRDFVLANQEVSEDGEVASDAALFGDNLLRNMTTQVATILSSSNDGEEISNLADVGLTFDENNYLELDDGTLEAALLSDLDAVKALFQFQMTASSSDIQLLRKGDGALDQNFTLDVTVDADGAITGASVGGDDSLFTVDGSRLIGADGTAYEGMVFIFTGDESTSLDIELSRGIAERLSNCLSAYTDGDDGQLQQAVEAGEDNIESMGDRVSDIERRAEDYRARLVEYYAYLESRISEANRMKSNLEALLSSDDN